MERLIGPSVVKQIQQAFSELKEPVQVLYFRSEADCEYCAEAEQLLEEVAAIDDRIALSVYDRTREVEAATRFGVDKSPSLVIAARDGEEIVDLGMRFSGVPSGHEFSTLVNDIVLASKRDSGLSQATRDFLKGLEKPLLLQVFVTPTCPYCPRAVLLAHQMAMENPRLIRAEGVEATEFQELAQQFYVSGVPQTVINSGAKMVVGAVPEINLVNQIKLALQN